MAMMQLAQAVDDVQYGMRGVVNNIPGLLMSLGAGAGLAGVVSIAAVAMYQLTTRFGEFVTGAKKAKEASDFVGQMTEKMNAALAQGAKEAENGTKEGAEALREATAAAEENFKIESTRLQNRIRLTEQAAAADLRLAEARIQASNATDEEKALQMMALREKEAQRAHLANMQRMREERDLLGDRAAAMNEAAREAAQRLNEARAAFEQINTTSVDGTKANPFVVEQAYNQMEAAAQDYEKAREAAAKANADAMRQAGQLGQEMNQQQKQLEKELAAIRLEGQEEAEAAAQRAADKETARRKKQMDELREAAEREAKWRADIEQKIQGERAETARKNEEQKKTLEILRAEAEIARLRAGGRNAGADRRQRELDLQRQAERIQADTGVDADEARRLAEQLNPDPRRAGRINARVRRRTEEEESAASRRQLGPGAFGGLRERLDREIGQVGLPSRGRGAPEASSREQLTKAPEVAADTGRTLKEMAKSLEAIQVNTEGLSKKKSEALARA